MMQMMRHKYAAGSRRIDHLTTPIPNLGSVLSMRVPVREESLVTPHADLQRSPAAHRAGSNTHGDCHYIVLSGSCTLSASVLALIKATDDCHIASFSHQ